MGSGLVDCEVLVLNPNRPSFNTRFYCLNGKKSKIREVIYSNSSVEDETYNNSELLKRPQNKSDGRLNIFSLGRHTNLFSQCFKGRSKHQEFSSNMSSPYDTYEDDPGFNTMLNATKEKVPRELPCDVLKVDVNRKSLAEKLFDLTRFGWYWGPLSQSEANEKLQGEAEGAFLVRDSSCDQYVLTLSFRSHQETFHTHIDLIGATFSLESSVYFDSMEDLIAHSMSHFLVARRNPNDNNNVIYVKLSHPISRFTQVRSLQYLCRFVIRQYVRADLRQNLPLPQSIREYIEERQF